METYEPFLFVAGDPSLDLVNTLIHHFEQTGPHELLKTPEAALNWYETCGLIDAAQKAKLKPKRKAVLDSARLLRTHLNRIYRALIADEQHDQVQKGLTGLNAMLGQGFEQIRLEYGPDGFIRQSKFKSPSPFDPAILVARYAAKRLETLESHRLKECANETCDLIFYDETRNASRRWCDMGTCGNRLKQARHRAANHV